MKKFLIVLMMIFMVSAAFCSDDLYPNTMDILDRLVDGAWSIYQATNGAGFLGKAYIMIDSEDLIFYMLDTEYHMIISNKVMRFAEEEDTLYLRLGDAIGRSDLACNDVVSLKKFNALTLEITYEADL